MIDTTAKPKCRQCILGCKKCSDLLSCDEWEKSGVDEIVPGLSVGCPLATDIVATGWNNLVQKEY